MKVLVFGRSGQVARSLLERGAKTDHDVTALGRPELDLTVPETLDRALEDAAPDVAINAAAYTAVDAAETEEAAAFAVNATGAGNLAASCAAKDVPLIHISTDYVFDGSLDRPYRETDPIAPQSAYGRSKAAGEAAVMGAGGEALIVRIAWVYSPFGQNFVKTMLRVGGERDHLRVVGDQRGNPTSALDVADALFALSKTKARGGWPTGVTPVHMAASDEATWYEFACAIFDASPLEPKVDCITTADYPTPARRPANSRLDCSYLEEQFQLSLPPWRESLMKVLEHLLSTRAQ
ncbi:MAG: dTDP-4-dehydrorhamnose reductase [Pseudomonadota bacterium]